MHEADMYLKHHLAAEEVGNAIAKDCLKITHVHDYTYVG